MESINTKVIWLEGWCKARKKWPLPHTPFYINVDGKWSEPIDGIGGSAFIAKERSGCTSDECFKNGVHGCLSLLARLLVSVLMFTMQRTGRSTTKQKTADEKPNIEEATKDVNNAKDLDEENSLGKIQPCMAMQHLKFVNDKKSQTSYRMKLVTSRVRFDNEAHTYTLDGKSLQGITGMIDRRIFGGKYANTDPMFLRKYAEYGSLVHNELDAFFTLDIPADNARRPAAFISWFKIKFNVKSETHTEYTVSDNEFFATNIDLVTDDGIWDYKTTKGNRHGSGCAGSYPSPHTFLNSKTGTHPKACSLLTYVAMNVTLKP